MEILKVKDWLKVKGQQFIPKDMLGGVEIMSVNRIKDNKFFWVSQELTRDKLIINGARQIISIYISHFHSDLIHVDLTGRSFGTERMSFPPLKTPINDIETSASIMSAGIKIQLNLMLS